MDLYSDKILEQSISLTPTVEFIMKPLKHLIEKRPKLPYRMTIYSDQGFQYQNKRYTHLLKYVKAFQSMSRKATCLNNQPKAFSIF
ncbi:hypothetical protein EFO90_07010 [Lactiplantibacillus plantarum]|nr:hypothetical protein [Lactiplantibacillus plantarum]MCT3271719.1 hypothetical protein [Lactiplantibacillus plantarum]